MKDSSSDSLYGKDLTSLSKEELVKNLRELQCRAPEASAAAIDHLQQTVQQLQVHRVELEMQNRALRETQQELEQSARRYADLFDHLPTGYLIVSLQGQILCANPTAMELLEPPDGEVAGKFVRRYLDAYDAGRFATHLEVCAASGRQSILELTFRPRDGSNIAVQFSSRLAPPLPGATQQIHIAVADISQLKRTQRMLEEINREQEAFNYSISHDLRAPLVTISNYARIVVSDHHEALDEEGTGMLHRIENAAMRMEETLKHLLEYSMLAREEVVLQSLDLSEVLRDVLIEHRGMIQQMRAEVKVAPHLPAVRGSRVILAQVLANLLTNALKYTQPGVPPQVEIGAAESTNGVILQVRDYGIGIEKKYHSRIFEIFERLHGYTKYPGSGVGLAIARRAVDRMKGRIWIESAPGEGSTFFIELARG